MPLDQSLYQYSISMWFEITLCASIVLGLVLHSKKLWPLRTSLASLESILIGASCGLLVVSDKAVWFIACIIVIQVYRLFGLFRIVRNRVNVHALRNKSLRTETFLCVATIILFLASYINLTLINFLYIAAVIQLVAVLVFFRHTLESKRVTQATIPQRFSPDSELPSITVAVPARNETQDLTECLHSILQTTYPKLEILVLDDCSQDNTSDIIRKFAHRGVRFLEGKAPDNSWLAKNFAYQQLYDEADGKYVLFCGTDVRFEQNSLRILVELLKKNELDMVSVLPIRINHLDRHFLLQPMRYWRELVIPRTFTSTPATLSTCWIADKSFLKELGGFQAYKKTIRPEKVIAREANKQGKYRFLRSSSGLGVLSIKNLRSQWNTAVRTRYPELRNRPENVLFSSFWQITVLLAPALILIFGLVYSEVGIVLLSLASMVIILSISGMVSLMVSGKPSILRLILFPLSVILEVIVTNYSMWAYEFSEVIWKGRNVCLPVLQANLRLPKIED